MPHTGQYELTWMENPPTRKTPNQNGIKGWAVNNKSTNAVYGPGKSFRVHICAHNPCRARWDPARYGITHGTPVHMQRITCMGPAAAPVLVWTAAPIADPSTIKTAVAANTQLTSAAHPTTVANNNAALSIRKPRSWLGYIALILFGLLKQCRPQMWEGNGRCCLLEQHAPWALKRCTRQCAYAAIACGFIPNPDGGHASLMQISDALPLTKMSHYVAGIDIPSAPPWPQSQKQRLMKVHLLHSTKHWVCITCRPSATETVAWTSCV